VVPNLGSTDRYRATNQLAPGREIAKCVLVVTPRAFWACDWSILPMEALLREYSRAAELQNGWGPLYPE